MSESVAKPWLAGTAAGIAAASDKLKHGDPEALLVLLARAAAGGEWDIFLPAFEHVSGIKGIKLLLPAPDGLPMRFAYEAAGLPPACWPIFISILETAMAIARETGDRARPGKTLRDLVLERAFALPHVQDLPVAPYSRLACNLNSGRERRDGLLPSGLSRKRRTAFMFGRRSPPPFSRRLRNWLWPAMGLRRTARYFFRRLQRIPGTPSSVAAGFAIGVAMGVSPIIGSHIVIAIGLAWLFRASILAAILGTLVSNPWTAPPIWLATYYIGRMVQVCRCGAGSTHRISSKCSRVSPRRC